MSLTPKGVTNQSLTSARQRTGRSPALPTSSYTSFPTAQQMERDRAASAAFDSPKPNVIPPKAARKSLCLSFITLCASAPALFGMCCWPSLAAAVVGGAVTGGSRVLSHTLSLIFTSITLTFLIIYLAYCTKERSQLQTSRIQVYGPFILLCVASLFVLADPIRHVLQDQGVWDGPSSDAFVDGCGEGWACLTTTGILFMGVFTYLGFGMLFTANFWNANLPSKISYFMKQWREIKAEHAATKVAEREAKRAAEAEAEQAAAAERERSTAADPPRTLSFGSLHLSMQPPAIFFKKEEANKIGYRVSPTKGKSASPQQQGGLPNTLDAQIKKEGEYRMEGYSYEVTSEHVNESVIKVTPSSKDGRRTTGTVPGASSPTLTASPSSTKSANSASSSFQSPSSATMFMSPLSNVALTPLHTNMMTSPQEKQFPIAGSPERNGTLQYISEAQTAQ